jgi:DNA-nicking Smr family endonuclease
MNDDQGAESGDWDHQPQWGQDRLSENEESDNNTCDTGRQPHVPDPMKSSLFAFRDSASFPQAALVLSQWIHNARLTTVEQQEEPVRIPITDVFDLHSVPPRDLEPIVEEYLEEARKLGLKALRIIHGRGIGVQREIVRAILARTAFVESFGDAPAEAGGWGATIVTLR